MVRPEIAAPRLLAPACTIICVSSIDRRVPKMSNTARCTQGLAGQHAKMSHEARIARIRVQVCAVQRIPRSDVFDASSVNSDSSEGRAPEVREAAGSSAQTDCQRTNGLERAAKFERTCNGASRRGRIAEVARKPVGMATQNARLIVPYCGLHRQSVSGDMRCRRRGMLSPMRAEPVARMARLTRRVPGESECLF